MATALPQVKAGKLRALGVARAKRASVLPAVPAMAEAGFPTLDVTAWFAILTPVKTPKSAVTRLNADLAKILAMPDVRERLHGTGVEPSHGGGRPDEIAAFIKNDVERWSRVIKEAGIRLD